MQRVNLFSLSKLKWKYFGMHNLVWPYPAKPNALGQIKPLFYQVIYSIRSPKPLLLYHCLQLQWFVGCIWE